MLSWRDFQRDRCLILNTLLSFVYLACAESYALRRSRMAAFLMSYGVSNTHCLPMLSIASLLSNAALRFSRFLQPPSFPRHPNIGCMSSVWCRISFEGSLSALWLDIA
ncbi:hypothetical protein V1507DRAFT_313374 [Lipomyces tetrasporus]